MNIQFNEEELCIAIIELGLRDLKRAYGKYKTCKSNKKEFYKCTIDEITRDLKSDWCRSLTKLDIDYLIKGVMDENKRVFRSNKTIRLYD